MNATNSLPYLIFLIATFAFQSYGAVNPSQCGIQRVRDRRLGIVQQGQCLRLVRCGASHLLVRYDNGAATGADAVTEFGFGRRLTELKPAGSGQAASWRFLTVSMFGSPFDAVS